jgi:predicted DNA repair protein MutK
VLFAVLIRIPNSHPELAHQGEEMAGGLAALLDDIAALAKVAAASIDDIGAAAGKASAKAAGVVIDDTAVTPAYVRGLAAKRELPIIKRIAIGSLRNKLLFIIPVALLLNAILPVAVDIILMFGGAYLCFEGAEKIYHKLAHREAGDKHSDPDVPAVMKGPEAEDATVKGAIRTDLILSAEIMVISLKGLIDDGNDGFIRQGIILILVAFLITGVVYGIVALIVKMDDIGLKLAEQSSETSQKAGRMLVNAMPKLLNWLTIIGTAAMLWVGGHIILVGTHELSERFDQPWLNSLYEPVHDIEEELGGALGWLFNTSVSAVIGLIVGGIIVAIVLRFFHKGDHDESHDAPAAAH